MRRLMSGMSSRRRSTHATVSDFNFLRTFARLRADCLDCLDHVHALGHRAEDHVLAIEPIRLHCAKEELGAVGTRSSVGHGEDPWSGVLQREVLVCELRPINGFAARAIMICEDTALAHEVWDHTVESASFEAKPLLAS